MLGCLIGLLAFFLPRVAILLLLLFGDWIIVCFRALTSPLNGLLLPVLGLLFVPYTLLAYCLAWHQNGGMISGMWTVLVVVAVLVDFGVIGQGGRSSRKWKKREQR
ncbi:MAG TPA: hypothetical protein PKE29_12465 [Phycisphaerales bacterium]|nr:hypothetical protein [Phycisphaerales bacterium]